MTDTQTAFSDALRTIAADVVDLLEGADEGYPEDLADQVAGFAIAKDVARQASQLADVLSRLITEHREHGARVETTAGWVVRVEEKTTFSKWRNAELREDLTELILTNPDGSERTGPEVLAALWDEKAGLAPLKGSDMRRRQFHALSPRDLDEYAEPRTKKATTIVVDPRKVVTV